MIPFRDNIPSRSYPVVTVALIAVNVGAFLYELSLGPALEAFIFQYGVIPASVVSWPESDTPFQVVALPFLTSMFLHAGWLHLIGNMSGKPAIVLRTPDGELRAFTALCAHLACFGAGIVH